MFFISLIKWKSPPTKDQVDEATAPLMDLEKQGIKMRVYWTLGRYDAVTFIEAPTEKDAMKALLEFQNIVDTETLVAVPREEAIKLL